MTRNWTVPVASGAVFTVTNPQAPREVVDPEIAAIAARLREEISGLTPRLTGRLASSWIVVRVGTSNYAVSTDVPYARFVEYGTRYDRAQAPMGRALAMAKGGAVL